MIQSTKGKLIKQVLTGSPGKGFPVKVFNFVLRKVAMIEVAAALEDLRKSPANHLEKLSGGRAGQYSIRIDMKWRICFTWGQNGPENLEITDYHD